MNNIVTKENCMFYGAPGLVILIISTLATVNISSHFNENTLVTGVAFVGCNVSGWLAYLSLQYLLGDLVKVSDILRGRNNQPLQLVAQSSEGKQSAVTVSEKALEDTRYQEQQISEGIVSTDALDTHIAQGVDEVVSNNPIPTVVPSNTDDVISNDHIPTPVSISQKQYDKVQMLFEQNVATEKVDRMRVMIEYASSVLAPFVEHDNLVKLCEELQKWCEDSEYRPEAIPLKYIADHKSRLSTIDFKHFVWNIGERMYDKTYYTSTCRAEFIKSMFPDSLSGNTIDSLRNLTNLPARGFIKLDKPRGSSYAFHLEK